MITIAVLVGACGSPKENLATPDLEKTVGVISSTQVAGQLTQIAESNQTQTPFDEFPTATKLPTLFATLPPITQPTTGAQAQTPCLAASLVSEEIPDGTLVNPGDSFVKIWTLQNIGTCTWTEEFTLVYHHGVVMSAGQRFPFSGSVAPGQSISLQVNMIAPGAPGTYQSFWTIESPTGEYFGPSANGTFWVTIVVPTATSLPTSRTISATGYSYRSDGKTDTNFNIGDNLDNYSLVAYATFDLSNIPANATITGVYIDLTSSTTSGNPFSNLGCVNISYSSTGDLMWTFCSQSALLSGAGDSSAIAGTEDGLIARQLDLKLEFDKGTNNNGSPDQLKISAIYLTVTYLIP